MLVVIGQLAGPAAGGILADIGGYRLAFTALVGVTAVTFAFALGIPRGTTAGHRRVELRAACRDAVRSYGAARRIVRGRGVLLTMAVSFLGLYLVDVRTALHPLYFSSVGLAPSTTGLFLSLAGACGLLAQPLLTVMRRRLTSGTIVAVSLVSGSGAVGAVIFFDTPAALGLLSALSGLSLGLVGPLTLLLTADYTRPDERGLGVGLRLVANRMSQWVSRVVFSAFVVMAGSTQRSL